MFRLAIVLTALLFTGTPLAAEEIVARNLFISQGCKGCHHLEGSGGIIGPALDKVGSRLQKTSIRNKLLAPKATNPDSLMPDFQHLKPEELDALVDFLANKK